MNDRHPTTAAQAPRGFELEGLEGRRLLSFVFVSIGNGGGHHGGHRHGDHGHHHGVFITVSFSNTPRAMVQPGNPSLFAPTFPGLPLPSFMPV